MRQESAAAFPSGTSVTEHRPRQAMLPAEISMLLLVSTVTLHSGPRVSAPRVMDHDYPSDADLVTALIRGSSIHEQQRLSTFTMARASTRNEDWRRARHSMKGSQGHLTILIEGQS